MQIHVKVKPGRRVEWLGWDGYEIFANLKAPPVEGAANQRLIEVLAECLHVGKSKIQITKGLTSQHKTLELDMNQKAFLGIMSTLPQIPRQEPLF